MRIREITITHVRIPLVEPFRISSGAVSEKDAIVVRVRAGGLTGFGESSPMAGSFYSEDTPESCWRELHEQVIPAVLAMEKTSLEEANRVLYRLPAGNFTKAGVETALWDLEAQRQGKPLCELLGGRRKAVESGLAVGLYDDVRDMVRAAERYLRDGYKRLKVKIERGRDVEIVRAAREAFGDIPLFVDANGAYSLDDLDVFRRLDEFGLMMFEQPFPAGMLEATAELQRQVRTPVCLDESLKTIADLRRAVELGAVRIANIKIQRVGGLWNALEMYRACLEMGLPVWVGTMPELGVGQAQGIALAALDGCVCPTDVEASLRWFRDDLIAPLIEVRDGLIKSPERPGLGYTVDDVKLRRYAVAEETVSV